MGKSESLSGWENLGPAPKPKPSERTVPRDETGPATAATGQPGMTISLDILNFLQEVGLEHDSSSIV